MRPCRARFSELCDEAASGVDKIITKNGKAYVAIISIQKLDDYRQLVRQRGVLLQLGDIERSLDAGRVMTETELSKSLKQLLARLRKKSKKK